MIITIKLILFIKYLLTLYYVENELLTRLSMSHFSKTDRTVCVSYL